jgi:hypothetical protein
MTTVNATKKLAKLTGQEVLIDRSGMRYVIFKGEYICFYNNGADEPGSNATCFHTQRVGSDHVTYHDNLTQAFKFVNR